MPFEDEELQIVYEDFVKPVVENDCECLCVRGDDLFGPAVIMDDIVANIGMSDIVIADLTRKNANVFYELGICHTLQKPTVLLAQSMEDVPFDVLRHFGHYKGQRPLRAHHRYIKDRGLEVRPQT